MYLSATYYFQTRLSLASAIFPLGIFDYIGSIAAVIVVLFVSYRILDKIPIISSFLSWFGKNSLIVLCAHLIEMVALPFQSVISFALSMIGISSQVLSAILVFVTKVLWCSVSIVIVHKIKFLGWIFNASKKDKTIVKL